MQRRENAFVGGGGWGGGGVGWGDNLRVLETLKDLPKQTHQHYLPASLLLEHGQAPSFTQTRHIFKMEENHTASGRQ